MRAPSWIIVINLRRLGAGRHWLRSRGVYVTVEGCVWGDECEWPPVVVTADRYTLKSVYSWIYAVKCFGIHKLWEGFLWLLWLSHPIVHVLLVRHYFTSTRLQQVTAPNMKDRPKDLGLVLQCKGFLKLCNCLHPVQQQKLGACHPSLVKRSV